MDQYAGSPGHSTYSYAELIASFMNFLHLLDFMDQGKITEENAPTIRLDATPSGLLEPPSPSPPPFLRQMPFLPQPSQFILAWNRHQIMVAGIPSGLVINVLTLTTKNNMI